MTSLTYKVECLWSHASKEHSEFVGIKCNKFDQVQQILVDVIILSPNLSSAIILLLAKEHVRCNGRKNTTHTLNRTTITQDHNRSISFILATHHICVAAYPSSHPRRRWPQCSHKPKRVRMWLILRRLCLCPPSPSLSLSLTLAMRNLLFSPATYSEVCMCSSRCFLFPI